MSTPSSAEFYESAGGRTFGEAAIKLAINLGMPWPTQCPAVRAVLGGEVGTSSAPTVTLPSGESVKSSPRTRSRKTGSTTGATGVDRGTAESAEPRSVVEES